MRYVRLSIIKMEAIDPLYVMLSLLCLSTSVYSAEGLTNNQTAKALVTKLKEGYGDTSVRPVHDHRQTTYVFLRMLLYELIEFNENQQKITLRSNMRLTWTDEYLQWDPKEWDNITNIYLHNNDIWRPDFDLEQNVQRNHFIIYDTYVTVDHTGTVNWYFPVITTSACKINIVYFPYDTQQCNVTFYPWTLDNTEMRLIALDNADANQQVYVRNGIWNLTQFQAFNQSILYKCCPYPFDQVTYSLTMARETAFFTSQIVIPSLFLTVLMLISFWLHPDSGEKISLTVTNLLALILFQQLVAQYMPPTGEPRSIVVTCFFILIALSACTVILTVIVLRVYHKDVISRPPSWFFMLLRIFISRHAEKKMSSIYKTLEVKQAIHYIDNGSSSLPESARVSTPLREDFIETKATQMSDSEDISNSFMWKHIALGIDRAFGIILSACMLGCIIYALQAFSAHH